VKEVQKRINLSSVITAEGFEGVEIVLEPMGFPPVTIYPKTLFNAGILLTACTTTDIQRLYRRDHRGAGKAFSRSNG